MANAPIKTKVLLADKPFRDVTFEEMVDEICDCLEYECPWMSPEMDAAIRVLNKARSSDNRKRYQAFLAKKAENENIKRT